MPTAAAKTAVLALLLLQATPAWTLRGGPEEGDLAGSLAETEDKCEGNEKCCCARVGETWLGTKRLPRATAEALGWGFGSSCMTEAENMMKGLKEGEELKEVEKWCVDKDRPVYDCCVFCAKEHNQEAAGMGHKFRHTCQALD
mmetsp:Transcript_51990/g.151061  ORF Transcript_51990/g.151061 Transcript_51990/m.151061 type:complete len:143 (-) Transcript_51990:38-466(-)